MCIVHLSFVHVFGCYVCVREPLTTRHLFHLRARLVVRGGSGAGGRGRRRRRKGSSSAELEDREEENGSEAAAVEDEDE